MRYLLFAILIYIAYQFIFNFLVPVFKTTRKLRKGFREMHNRMQEQMQKEQGFPQSPPAAQTPNSAAGEYIDFEELK